MANIDPTQIFQLMGTWQRFTARHPKFPKFLQAVASEGVQEGTILEMKVATPEGKEYCSNMRITQEDLELLEQLKKILH